MRRIALFLVLFVLPLALVACHETSSDDSTTTTNTEAAVNVKEGETADLGGVKITIVKSALETSQLTVSVRVENQSSSVISLKGSALTATDASNTNGLPTTCGGRGGFSGDLAVGDKLDSTVCWFMVGAKPPITVTFSSGTHKASFTLAVQ